MSQTTDRINDPLGRLNGAGWLLLTERERREVINSCRPLVDNQTQALASSLVFGLDFADAEARAISALRRLDSAVGHTGIAG